MGKYVLKVRRVIKENLYLFGFLLVICKLSEEVLFYDLTFV